MASIYLVWKNPVFAGSRLHSCSLFQGSTRRNHNPYSPGNDGNGSTVCFPLKKVFNTKLPLRSNVLTDAETEEKHLWQKRWTSIISVFYLIAAFFAGSRKQQTSFEKKQTLKREKTCLRTNFPGQTTRNKHSFFRSADLVWLHLKKRSVQNCRHRKTCLGWNSVMGRGLVSNHSAPPVN